MTTVLPTAPEGTRLIAFVGAAFTLGACYMALLAQWLTTRPRKITIECRGDQSMPINLEDPETQTYMAGTFGGIIGGIIASLSRPMTRKEVLLALVGGMGFGAFLPPAIMAYHALPPGLAGIIGFASGLCVFGLVAASQSLSARLARRPETFLPSAIAQQFAAVEEPKLPVPTSAASEPTSPLPNPLNPTQPPTP